MKTVALRALRVHRFTSRHLLITQVNIHCAAANMGAEQSAELLGSDFAVAKSNCRIGESQDLNLNR